LAKPPGVSAQTLAAYRAAVYRIFGEPDIDMRIGLVNRDAAALLKRHHAESAVFVTAFNPFGVVLEAPQNQTRQQALRRHIESMNLRALSGVGFDPAETNPHSEASLLVLDSTPILVDALLRDFEQNAVVIVDARGLPQLVLHPTYR
jgi:hypothetical protein